jgi:hypothetical protein
MDVNKLYLPTVTRKTKIVIGRLNIDADLRVKISSMQSNLDKIMNKKERIHLSHKVRKSMQ